MFLSCSRADPHQRLVHLPFQRKRAYFPQVMIEFISQRSKACEEKTVVQAITFHKCRHLKVRNMTLLNSPHSHITFTGCFHVKVSGLKVIAPVASPDTDGIHISGSETVYIQKSEITTGAGPFIVALKIIIVSSPSLGAGRLLVIYPPEMNLCVSLLSFQCVIDGLHWMADRL